ncbi:OB-fold protein [Pseudomonas sp. UBA6562]|uniref:OB-fold protein n=1 Tax=Pseudomonas sp. UBA6562 TaxID=1947332 RepID=UPI0025DCFC1B|nr:hypothetical protein [Pseudomonas sp. UBA6562]
MNDVPTTQKRPVGFLLGLGILFIPVIFVWFLLRKGHSTLARIVGFGWLVLCLFAVFSGESERQVDKTTSTESTASSAAPVSDSQAPAYLSSQVAQLYEENTVAADMKFKGKRVKVSGRVTDINTDFMGNPYLVLAGSNPYLGPQFKFAKSAIEVMATIKKGSTVQVICTGRGDVAKTPMFEDCKIAN